MACAPSPGAPPSGRVKVVTGLVDGGCAAAWSGEPGRTVRRPARDKQNRVRRSELAAAGDSRAAWWGMVKATMGGGAATATCWFPHPSL
ncbi:hypothetical protein FKM82_015214 [Ascaphus truei]